MSLQVNVGGATRSLFGNNSKPEAVHRRALFVPPRNLDEADR
jgi:hypothetical protein